MFKQRKFAHISTWLIIFLVALCFSVLSGTKTVAVTSPNQPLGTVTQINEAHSLFENGQYPEAIKVLQQFLNS